MIGRDVENNLRRRQSSPVQGRRNVNNFKDLPKKNHIWKKIPIVYD